MRLSKQGYRAISESPVATQEQGVSKRVAVRFDQVEAGGRLKNMEKSLEAETAAA